MNMGGRRYRLGGSVRYLYWSGGGGGGVDEGGGVNKFIHISMLLSGVQYTHATFKYITGDISAKCVVPHQSPPPHEYKCEFIS